MIKSPFLRAAAVAALLSACVPMVSTLSLYKANGPGAKTSFACWHFKSSFQYPTGSGAIERSEITFVKLSKPENTYEVSVQVWAESAANPVMSLAGVRVQSAGKTYQPTLVRQEPPKQFKFLGALKTSLSGFAQFRLGNAQPDSVVILPPPGLLAFGGKPYAVPPMKFDWTVEKRPHLQPINC